MSNSLFYAYAKHATNDWSARYIITFATRDVADSWYRAVTDSVANGHRRFAAVRRITPQLYIHEDGDGDIAKTVTDSRVAANFLERVFFTHMDDRNGKVQNIIPILNNCVDNISGDRYYIRAASHPGTFWYYDRATETVVASRDRRTKFTFTIADTTRSAGTIMIGSDDIVVHVGSSNLSFRNQRLTCGSGQAMPFKFSALSSGFEVDEDGANAGNLGAISQSVDGGDRWELAQ